MPARKQGSMYAIVTYDVQAPIEIILKMLRMKKPLEVVHQLSLCRLVSYYP